jgi:pyruvate dehydrogenase E2 component (dihydrolipoamide acetyltransferase)
MQWAYLAERLVKAMIEITMPRLSDTMEEGEILKWHKSPGDAVAVGDVLVEIETDKATMEYEAFEAGTFSSIVVNEGEVAVIGQLIALIDDGKGGAAPASAPKVEAPAAKAPEVAPAVEAAPVVEAPVRAKGERFFASPIVRRLAADQGIDLALVNGTGPGGRIVRADLDNYVKNGPKSLAPSRPTIQPTTFTQVDPKRGSEQLELSKIRRIIAKRLGESYREIPHFFVTAIADLELLQLMRADLNAKNATTDGPKVSVNDLLVKAVALALREHPMMNVSYQGDDSPTMLVNHRYNIGVAVASKNGLVVPVIEDADQKDVNTISSETKKLVNLASTRGLSVDQMSGGTFTISNLGMFGVEEFTAIINPPEAAILAVGAAIKEPVVVGDKIEIRTRTRLTLSSDHRVIDGALAAQFLQTLTGILENPWRILA